MSLKDGDVTSVLVSSCTITPHLHGGNGNIVEPFLKSKFPLVISHTCEFGISLNSASKAYLLVFEYEWHDINMKK